MTLSDDQQELPDDIHGPEEEKMIVEDLIDQIPGMEKYDIIPFNHYAIDTEWAIRFSKKPPKKLTKAIYCTKPERYMQDDPKDFSTKEEIIFMAHNEGTVEGAIEQALKKFINILQERNRYDE